MSGALSRLLVPVRRIVIGRHSKPAFEAVYGYVFGIQAHGHAGRSEIDLRGKKRTGGLGSEVQGMERLSLLVHGSPGNQRGRDRSGNPVLYVLSGGPASKQLTAGALRGAAFFLPDCMDRIVRSASSFRNIKPEDPFRNPRVPVAWPSHKRSRGRTLWVAAPTSEAS